VKVIKSLTDFDQEIRKSTKEKKLTVVDFAAKWCPPCRMIAPRYDELATSNKYPKVSFLKVDVDDVQELAARFKIRSMPTFLFLGKNGEEVDRFSGANLETLHETIQKSLISMKI
jgi:thioredoxin 1